MQPENNLPTDQFSQVVERLRSASNVLVTVSSNPSVDQLAACIGLTLALNKQNKHAAAVFSGEPPSTIEFLKPEDTLEKTTDSLRDFIISLDKSKADKLRYKVEDNVVKIFITPYRTSITEKDFDFSQGDFNVDAVMAIGVKEKNDLDTAIVAHGRILHDATVISVNTAGGSELGSINWTDAQASSLCEMTTDLVDALDKNLFDTQIATSLLTGIVAETDRFRNERSNPHTMSVAGTLMSAGASTQLIASKLEEPVRPPTEIPAVTEEGDQPNPDGMIEIDHSKEPATESSALKSQEEQNSIHIDESGNFHPILEEDKSGDVPTDDQAPDEDRNEAPSIITEPPRLGGQLTANSVPEYQQYGGTTDPLSSPAVTTPLLSRDSDNSYSSDLPAEPLPPSPTTQLDTPTPVTEPSTEPSDNNEEDKTLSEIEQSLTGASEPVSAPPPAPLVHQPTLEEIEKANASGSAPAEPSDARDAVQKAVEAIEGYKPEPIEALGATRVNLDLGHEEDVEDDKPSDGSSTTPSVGPPPPVPPPVLPPGV